MTKKDRELVTQLRAEVIALQARARALECQLLASIRKTRGQIDAAQLYAAIVETYRNELQAQLIAVENHDPGLAAELQRVIDSLPEPD